MPDRVRITEVGPRDGLQNEPGVIPTAEKVRLVELCAATGVDEVEVTSFVSPKWVPQLGDASEVMTALSGFPRKTDNIGRPIPHFSALVPNEKGLEAAKRFAHEDDDRGAIWKISVFIAASETFSRRNINATIAESLDRVRQVVGHGPFAIRGYLSCVIACPFEGQIAPEKVASVAGDLFECGVDEIDLGDTIGAGTPETVRAMLIAVATEMRNRMSKPPRDNAELLTTMTTLHLHDTFNRAADCVKAALDLGVRSFDGSVAGLGGCPYASTPGKRAPGNISTETLVRTIHAAGYETGVDLDKLSIAADYAREIVARARASA